MPRIRNVFQSGGQGAGSPKRGSPQKSSSRALTRDGGPPALVGWHTMNDLNASTDHVKFAYWVAQCQRRAS